MLTRVRFGTVLSLVSFLLFYLVSLPRLHAYSVLGHEALIDAVWDTLFVPLLLKRYPGATRVQLREAHAYAYGGSVIQDMGYYPFANRLFSNLTHYVRSGDFVRSLIDESRDINECAFALGALSHYVADNTGHPLATNLSVAEMYPELRQKYGRSVTYQDDPGAHVMVEFSFDVAQIAGAGYLPRTYHNFLGFKVAKSLLERVFKSTYCLELSKVFLWEDLSIKIYKTGASDIIPTLTQVVWRQERVKITRIDPQGVRPEFIHRLSPQNYRRLADARGRSRLPDPRPWSWHWPGTARRASSGFAATVVVYFIKVLPKIGPLHTLKFKPPTSQVQLRFIESFDVAVEHYAADLFDLLAGRSLLLANRNLDTGGREQSGGYELASLTYEDLLDRLARRRYGGLTPQLRQDILGYFADSKSPVDAGKQTARRRKVRRELSELEQMELISDTK